MSIHIVHDCKIGGRRARLMIRRNYGPNPNAFTYAQSYPWEVWIDEVVANGEAETEREASEQMWSAVHRLRKERRKTNRSLATSPPP